MSADSVTLVAKVIAGGAVVLLVTSLGLGVTIRQLAWVFARPGLLLRSVVAVLVLVPVVALLVAGGFGVNHSGIVGIVLMGVSPAAPLALRRASQARGDANFSPGIQVVLAVLAIASIPLTLALLSRLFPASQAVVSPWAIASQVGRVQLLPLAAGMAVRAARPALAEHLARPLARFALLLLVIFVAAALALQGADLLRVGLRTYAAIASTVAVSIALGHLLGGPSPETRTVLAVASALRNPGLALLIVQLNFAGQGIAQVLLAYALVTLVSLTTYGAWRRSRSQPAA